MGTNDTNMLGMQLVSDGEKDIFMLVNFVIISAVISLFGLVANAINIVVFIKQGFHSTMNITFFSLAMSDMSSLLVLIWVTVTVNPLFINSDINLLPIDVAHLTGGIPHLCFARITVLITVFITAERCLCITFPLKIKQIITPKVTMATIVFIYISVILSFLPEYEMFYLDWKFVPARNRSLIGLVVRNNMDRNEGLCFVLYSVLGIVCFVAVIVLTLVLVVQLKQKTKWRKKASGDQRGSESISIRDKKSVNMVVLIATVLIVCYTPGILVTMATFFVDDFSLTALQRNLYYSVFTFVFIFDALNSSVNIFLYYNMSTKYRETFNKLFGISKGDESKEGNEISIRRE